MQENPDKPNPDTSKPDKFRDGLTTTDKTFYDRAMRDFGEPYYRFNQLDKDGEPIMRELKCAQCGKSFTTTLSLNKYCSYEHYHESLAA